ncbi:hypothetical protein BJY01DRAFT_218293 [Aspergillus pseudoustus]|uniref:Uncharacterized protein n=1 Tax=Aspergillus pseudoustus TaxID=1810923 RepID=A0ABR4JLT5_9EURO
MALASLGEIYQILRKQVKTEQDVEKAAGPYRNLKVTIIAADDLAKKDIFREFLMS